MQPRDIFDGLLVGFALVVLYLEIVGFGFSPERLDTLVDALAGLNVAFYVVIGGFVAIGFLIYAFVYVPGKQGKAT